MYGRVQNYGRGNLIQRYENNVRNKVEVFILECKVFAIKSHNKTKTSHIRVLYLLNETDF